EQGVGDMLLVADGDGPGPAAGVGRIGQLERADDVVLILGVAVDPLAEIEDHVRFAAAVEPAEFAQLDRNQCGGIAAGLQAVLDLAGIARDMGDVLLVPMIRPGIEQDGSLHAAATLRSRLPPLIRCQAISATLRIISSYERPAARAALGKQLLS